MRSRISAILAVVVFSVLVFVPKIHSADKDLDTFWAKFKTAVLNNDKDAVAKLSLLASQEEKEYFLESYSETFDQTAINKIRSTNAEELKQETKRDESDEVSSFDLIDVPEGISSVFTLSIPYKLMEDGELQEFTQVFTFAKIKGNYCFLGTYSLDQ